MAFVNDYKNRGGRVTVGSDSGFIYQLYGFGTIQELELLREAGFHPLGSAPRRNAQRRPGARRRESHRLDRTRQARRSVPSSDENPVANFKVMYGTGHVRLGDDGSTRRVGGVNYTVKDGIVYDARRSLSDVRDMVAEEKRKRGITQLAQP